MGLFHHPILIPVLNPRFIPRVYYYFYERSREVILRSKPGVRGKALHTMESILIGFIAGNSSQICAVSFLIHEMHRLCYNCNQQPYMGRPDFPSCPYNEIFRSEQRRYSSKTWLFQDCEKHSHERRPCVDPVFHILLYRLIST